MASLSAVSSLSGLKVQSLRSARVATTTSSRPGAVVCSAGNVWDKAGKALVAVGAGLCIATAANAVTVKLGDDSGALVFSPSKIAVTKGEAITFINNAGFPHNIEFDEDAVPAGVNVDSISHPDYMNAKGESFTVALKVPGTYELYCDPHVGNGMKAVITVK